MTTATGRAARSDGIRSREAILRAAARLASTDGLEHLSIGELAAEVGMSKSGLYAHFRSKEELQLATIEMATAIFEVEVLEPARRYPMGRDGLIALSDAFVEHLRRRVFPGGCFFNAAAADLYAHPGRVRDAIGDFEAGWRELVLDHLRAARNAGDLAPDTDLELAAFDVVASHALANGLFRFWGDERVIDQAERSVRTRLGVAPDYVPSPAPDPASGRAPVRRP